MGLSTGLDEPTVAHMQLGCSIYTKFLRQIIRGMHSRRISQYAQGNWSSIERQKAPYMFPLSLFNCLESPWPTSVRHRRYIPTRAPRISKLCFPIEEKFTVLEPEIEMLTVPVQKLLSSLSKNTIIFAISSGLAGRPRAFLSLSAFICSGERCATSGVATNPLAFQRTVRPLYVCNLSGMD